MQNVKEKVVCDVMQKVTDYLKDNFPNRTLMQDRKMISEIDCEVYGFHGIQVLVRDCGDYIRYYPLIPSML